MGAYLGLVTPGVPVLGAFMFNSIYKFEAYRFTTRNVFTNKTWTDAYRGAGRPEATFGIERIMDELAVELGHGPDGAAREELDHARGVPVHHGVRPRVRLRQLRGRHRPRRSTCSTTRGCGASRPSGASARTRCSWASAISTFTEMCGLAPSRVLGSLSYARRRLGARGDPDAAHRQGRGRHGHQPARPGPRDGVEPDRRRPARRRLRGRRGAARRHPDLATRASTPTAPARWSWAASRWSRPPTR